MTEVLSVGVVGAGAIAQVAHLPALSRVKGAQIIAVCDNDIAKAQALGSRLGVRDVYNDIEDLMSFSRPDVVVICTPNHLHEVHVIAALSARAHVLCERPLALSVAGIETIQAAARRAERIVMAGMNRRFRSDVQAVKGFLEGGELGGLRAMRAGWYVFRPSRSPADWRQRRAESGGGALLDLGLPLLDLALWMAGRPVPIHVTATLTRSDGVSAVEDSGCALVVCENGFSMFIDVSWHHVGDAERFWFDVNGSKGSASIARLRVFKELHGAPVNVTPTGAAGRENAFSVSYRAEWAHFLAAVRGEVEPPQLEEQIVLHRILS